MSSLRTVINISILILIARSASSQQIVTGINVTINLPNTTAYLVTNGTPNSGFIEYGRPFDCSLTPLYTYYQDKASLNSNARYTIDLVGLTQPTAINISTVHKNFVPTYNPTICQPPSCTVTIQNNCAYDINFFNYFDRVLVNIQNFPTELSYYVKCNEEFLENTF